MNTVSMGSCACPMKQGMRVFGWVLQIAAAVILGQTLFFKFSGPPEAVHIFTTLGVEPWGRIGTGVMEAIAVVLLLVPRATIFGAMLGVGLMVGAIGSHLGPLGIAIRVEGIESDGGLLFTLALVVLVCSAGILAIRRGEVFALIARLRGNPRGG